MYAVVSTGGKQYRVEAGTTLSVERLPGAPGETVTFERVLLVADGDELTVGTPTVAGATVSGTVLAADRGPKLIIYKFKNKARYRRRTGHRQQLTRVRIDAIETPGGGRKRAAAKPAEEKAPAEAEAKAVPKRPARKASAKAASTKADKAKAASGEKKATTRKKSAPRKQAKAEE
jgi:large subunit ribosomal protein L21